MRDPGEGESGGWGDTETSVVENDGAEQPDYIGVGGEGDMPPEETITETGEEETREEAEGAEEEISEQAAEQEAAQEAAPVVETVAADWRTTVTNEDLIAEAVKKIPREQLLKAANIDEETLQAILFKEANNGDWGEYLRVKNTDYSKLSKEQLVEMDLREKYKALDQRKFAVVLKNHLSKYNLDREDFTEDSDEAVLGEVMLDTDSSEILAKLLDKQNSLKPPEKQPDTTAHDREVLQQEITGVIRNSEPIKSLSTTKILSFGEGDEAFNYEITHDVNTLVQAATTAAIQNGKAPTDAEISWMLKTLTFHMDANKVINALLNHGKTLGKKAIRKNVVNTHDNSSTAPGSKSNYTDDASLLAGTGRIVNKQQ